jgi:hypothetical protein
VRRFFWLAFGVGAGATGAVLASRWARKQAKKVAPTAIASEAKGGLLELSRLVAESLDEGKRAMREREDELKRPPAHAGSTSDGARGRRPKFSAD